MSKYLKRLHFALAKTQYIPLQTGLRFRSRGYERPPHQRACGITNSKQLAGTPNPRSWKGMKLTTYPSGGEGTASLGAIHSGCAPQERGRSRPSATRASRSFAMMVEEGHGLRGGQRSPYQPSPNGGGGGGGDEVHGFLFPSYSLRLQKPEQKVGANGRVTNHCWPPSEYIKARARTVQNFARTRCEIQNSKVKRSFRSSNGSHA
jgi:hypothetical protein